MIWISFEALGIIFIIVILLAIGGVHLIVSHLYTIVLILVFFMGLAFLIIEIASAISKKRPIYLLNGLLGCAFFLFGFELLYETISLINGSVRLLESTIIFAIICVILTAIIISSYHCEKKSKYRILSLIHSILIIAITCIIPFIGVNRYFHNEIESISIDNSSKLEIQQDSNIYLEVNLNSGNTFNSSWYPLDLKIPVGTLKKGTQVYFSGDSYGEYYKVTDGQKVGYVKKDNLTEN